MKTRFSVIIASVALLIAGCQAYDDSALNSKISDLEARVLSLESWKKQISSDVASLSDLVKALQNSVTVKNVTKTPEGWDILLTDGSVLNILNGTNGVNGTNGTNGTVVGVAKDTDGVFYWTVNGEWLIADGAKVKAQGIDGAGIQPEFKIEDRVLYVSYDRKNTWTRVGDVGSGVVPAITAVSETSADVTFTLADGSAITLAKYAPLVLTVTGPSSMKAGETETFAYTLAGGDDSAVVAAAAQGAWQAVATPASASAGSIAVTAPAEWSDGTVFVFATAADKMAMKIISIKETREEAPSISVSESIVNIGDAATSFHIPVEANFVPSVSGAESWISCVETKASYDYTVTVEANPGDARSATLTFSNAAGTASCTVTVNQAAHVAAWTKLAEWPIQSKDRMSAYGTGWTAESPNKGTLANDSGTLTFNHTGSVAAGTTNTNNNKLDVPGSSSSSSGVKAYDPRVYGTWEGDNFVFESAAGAAAGDKVKLYFEMQGSATTIGYWMMEYLDGSEWKPVAAVQSAAGKNYTHRLPVDKVYTPMEAECTLTAAVDKVTFRFTAVTTFQTDGVTERKTVAEGGEGAGGWIQLVCSSADLFPKILIWK